MQFRRIAFLALPVLAGALSMQADTPVTASLLDIGNDSSGVFPYVVQIDGSAPQHALQIAGNKPNATILSSPAHLYTAQEFITVLPATDFIPALDTTKVSADAWILMNRDGITDVDMNRVSALAARDIWNTSASPGLETQVLMDQAFAGGSSMDLSQFAVLSFGTNIFTQGGNFLIHLDTTTSPDAAAAPEPTTMALIGLPVLAFGIYRKRKSALA